MGANTIGRYHRICSVTEDGRVAWIVRLVQIGADGGERCADVMGIDRPDDLADIGNLGLTLAEAKRVLAGLHRRSSPRKPEATPFGGRIAEGVVVFAM